MTWTDTKAEIFSEGTTCQVWRKELDRECKDPGVDLDHALFSGRQRNSKVRVAEKRWLDSHFNAQRACDSCNRWVRTADTREAILHHIRRNIRENDVAFLAWFRNPPPGISTVQGSKYQEITRIVERVLNDE